MTNTVVQRGDIFFADLRPGVVGSEQGGIRPVLIVQNDIGNKYSPTTIVVVLTSRNKKSLPTHVEVLHNTENGLKVDSLAMCEQFRTIDKQRLQSKIGHIDKITMENVLNAVKISLSMI